MKNNIQAVLFDLDGTVIDTGELIAETFRRTIRDVLKKDIPDEELLKHVGQPLKIQMDIIAPGRADELVSIYRQINEVIHPQFIKIFPNTKKTLEQLQKLGYPIGIVTSKARQAAVRGLEEFNLFPYINSVITSDDVTRFKPDPLPVISGAQSLNIPVEKCLYIGDSPYDIQSANAAGAVSVAALWGMFSQEVLIKEKPCYQLQGIEDVFNLL